MPYPRFPAAFLSCSFDPTDVDVFTWFSKMLESLEFRVLSGKDPSPHPLPDVVRERILEANVFVGVLTRRDKVQGSEEWLPPSWVRDELAMARAHSKPCAVFAEAGVRVDGVVPLDAKYERWDRTDLGAAAPTVVRYMVALRNEISPPTESSDNLPTIRALGEELSQLAGWVSAVEETLEGSGWTLAMVTARNTGRLFTLPDDLKSRIVEAYGAVGEVDRVLEEITKAREKMRSMVKAVLSDFSLPPLPKDHVLRSRLHEAATSAHGKISTAWAALFRAGYPKEWAEMKRQVAGLADGPEKEVATTLLNGLFGE